MCWCKGSASKEVNRMSACQSVASSYAEATHCNYNLKISSLDSQLLQLAAALLSEFICISVESDTFSPLEEDEFTDNNHTMKKTE